MEMISPNGDRQSQGDTDKTPRQVRLYLFLGFIAIAVLVALMGVGVARQRQFGITIEASAESGRIVVQLQRETLRLLQLVGADPASYDPDAVQLQRDLLASRFNVVRQPVTRSFIPLSVIPQVEAFEEQWEEILPVLDEWQANPEDQEIQADLTAQLTEMERAMNSTEIAFHRERIAEISGIARAGQEWLVGLGAAALLIVLLIVLLAYNLYRVIQQQQIAEAAEASARESNRLKSEFIATMSHELRTPLNGVIGYADFLMTSAKGTLTEKQVDYLNRILSNGERLLRLVDDILDVSRIEADRIELLQSPYAPEELLASLRPDLQTLASAKGIELRTHYDPALPEEMIGDRHRLGQIVTNLVGNAVKFTDTGFIEVRFERKKADRWQITVSDSGIGIPAHAQTYIFERFRQVDGSLERKQGGVGLGLHIVRNLVILMGGTVSVESETNQGSTFRVELPVVVTEGVPTA